MKFTVNLEDFWLEEEELTDALSAHIKNSVVSQISKNVQKQVEAQIVKKVSETINEKIALVIDSTLSDLVSTGIIARHGEEISIEDHIKKVFQENHGWNSPDEKMKKIAKEFGNELKLQYNNVFANKIVQSMKEQGLLKDEVVQILLGGKDEN